MVRLAVSLFDLSQTLPVGSVSYFTMFVCSLPGPPVMRQFMQMFTVVPGQGGLPLTNAGC